MKKQTPNESETQLRLSIPDNSPAECERLRAENSLLRLENEQLKAKLAGSANQLTKISESTALYRPALSAQTSPVTTPAEKIALFQSLFRGRTDVYAERWQKKDGTFSYPPVKIHFWESHTQTKQKKWQCGAECKSVPLNQKILEEHLKGIRTVGIYPLLLDETCWFLAFDFDKLDWREDVLAFLATCDRNGVPAYLERSRSGTGAHVWIFFDKPIRAAVARSFGTFLLSEAKQSRYQLGFKSFDRMFPNQDFMPKGGYGNLIALPLQLEPRKAGNSVFIDRNFQPYEDQWMYLNAVVRMKAAAVESMVREASVKQAILTMPLSDIDPDSDEPWKIRPSGKAQNLDLKPPFPKKIALVLSNMIYIPKFEFGSAALSKLMDLAAFQNPEFYRMQATRQSTHDTPRVICCADDHAQHLALPRGRLDDLLAVFRHNNIAATITDERTSGAAIDFSFKGQLRSNQLAAAKQLITADLGILSASTAFGKTVLATHMISQRKVSTLILVHTVSLIDQWKEKLEGFLVLPPNSVGQLGGGKKKRTGLIDIATIQSLVRKGVVSDIVAEYGQIIVDECHHISAFSFEQVIKQAKAKYVLGLTATLVRKDGHHPIIMMHCGDVRYKDAFRNRKLFAGIKHAVIPRQTTFQFSADSNEDTPFHELYDALANDESRNELIFDDILKELQQGRSPLVITERIEHLDGLASKLQGFAKNIIVLKGGMTKKERLEVYTRLKAIPDGEERLILASGKYVGEGFDDSRLDTLFLLLPVSFEGKVEQYVGRLHREHFGKNDLRIYDYVDSRHPILRKMFERRCVKYRKLGYEIG